MLILAGDVGDDGNDPYLTMVQIPAQVPVMALSGAVLFPHSLLPLHIFEPRYRAMLEHSLGGDRMFSVALVRPGIDEPVALQDLFPVAGVGLIRACVGNDDGTSNLVLQGLTRVRFLDWAQTEPFRIARIEIVPSVIGNAIEAEALGEKVKEFCSRFEEIGAQLPANLIGHLHRIESTEVLADVVAAAFVADPPHRQQLLEAVDVCARLRLLIQFLRKQLAS